MLGFITSLLVAIIVNISIVSFTLMVVSVAESFRKEGVELSDKLVDKLMITLLIPLCLMAILI